MESEETIGAGHDGDISKKPNGPEDGVAILNSSSPSSSVRNKGEDCDYDRLC